MDKLKDKLKKLKLNPFEQTKTFKGPGHKLGSAAPSQLGGGASSSAQALQHPAQRASQQRQQQPPAHRPAPTKAAPIMAAAAGGPSNARPPAEAAAAAEVPAAAAAPALARPPSAEARAAPSVEPQLPLQVEPEGVLSFEQREAVEAAVAQLASDTDALSAGSVDVLLRLLRNVAANPGDPKFRRLRLSNPKVQAAVVEAAGGVELLLACGFEVQFEEGAGGDGSQTEGYAVLQPAAELSPIRHALLLLQPLATTAVAQQPPSQQQQGTSAPPIVASSHSGNSAAGVQQGSGSEQAGQATPAPAPRQQQPQQQWDPPRERATQVLLPQSPATEMPEWFFSRTGAELKTAFLAAVRRREQDQVLMTRAMRERAKGPAPSSPSRAIIRVRLPEGICLQGEFNPREPVSAVFAWVTDCLRDPGCTYELVLPSRKPLQAAGQSVQQADLLGAVTLNFRWTGQAAADMQTTPALTDDLLRAAHD